MNAEPSVWIGKNNSNVFAPSFPRSLMVFICPAALNKPLSGTSSLHQVRKPYLMTQDLLKTFTQLKPFVARLPFVFLADESSGQLKITMKSLCYFHCSSALMVTRIHQNIDGKIFARVPGSQIYIP